MISNIYPKVIGHNRISSTNFQKCEICGTKDFSETRMWYFPENEFLCRQWLKYVGNEDLVYIPIEKLRVLKKVCADHFSSEDFTNNRNDLKKNAIPLVQLTRVPLPDDIFAEFPFHLASSVASKNQEGGTTTSKMIEKHNNGACNTSTSQPKYANQSFKNYLHQDLVKNWSNILCQGLPWEVKMKLMNKYKIPNNSALLAAPLFNPRITNILPKSTKTRDDIMRNNQQQLSLAIAALGRVLSRFLTDNYEEHSETKEIINDACEILADLHCMMSQHRLSMLTGDESFAIASNNMGMEAQYNVQ